MTSKRTASRGKASTKAARSSKQTARKAAPRQVGLVNELVEALPAPVEKMELVQRTAALLDQGEQRAVKLLNEGRNEVERALEEVSEGYERFSSRAREEQVRAVETVRGRAEELLVELRDSRAARMVSELPAHVEQKFDAALLRVGLMRVSLHEEAIARLLAKRRPARRKGSAAVHAEA